MIETKLYKCEICGTTYGEKEACKACEAFHIHPEADGIEGKRFLPKNQCNVPYPDQITVRMKDGNKLLYTYKTKLGRR